MDVAAIYAGSDGEETTALYERIEKLGNVGVVAMNLFRACKASERAKKYRRRYKGVAYEKKNWSLKLLCGALSALDKSDLALGCSTPGCTHPDGKPCISCGFIVAHGIINWGWKEDPNAEFHNWVLYVDLPNGQVSFHAATPLSAHRYEGEWDGEHASAHRIIEFAQAILDGRTIEKAIKPIATLFEKPEPPPLPEGTHAHLDCVGGESGRASVETLQQDRLL